MSYIVPVTSGIDTGKIKWLTDSKPNVRPGDEAAAAEAPSFKSILGDVVNNVIETENQRKIDSYNLSIGKMDDMHTMMINEMKAEVALDTMVQIRNKLLDAYKEIMNTNI